MPEPTPLPVRKKRGPNTPEGKARSAMNALKHGLRARSFGLLPEESQAEWAEHLGDLRASYRPQDAAEEKLVTAHGRRHVAGDPRRPDPGRDAWPRSRPRPRPQPRHRPAGPAPRRGAGHRAPLPDRRRHGDPAGPARVPRPPQGGQGRAGATRRTQPARRAAACPSPPIRTARTNSQPPRPSPSRPRPSPPNPSSACAVAARAAGGDADADDSRQRRRLDDEAWLATVPVVEADPEREAERRRGAAAGRAHEVRRAVIGHAPAARHRAVPGRRRPRRLRGMVRPPAQAAAQPGQEPDRRGRGRGRAGHPPQPALDPRPVSRLLPPAGAGPPVPARRHRRRRAASRAPSRHRPRRRPRPRARPARAGRPPARPHRQPRLPEELDLAEAICAVKWPNWPDYRGPIDLGLLRLALEAIAIDAATLHWLDSHELARACREAGANKDKPYLCIEPETIV